MVRSYDVCDLSGMSNRITCYGSHQNESLLEKGKKT